MQSMLRVVLLIGFLLPSFSSAAEPKDEALSHYRLASKAFVERRFDTTIEELRKSLALDSKQLSALRLLGLSYQLTNRMPEAEATFREACELSPKDAESWFYLGRIYYLQNFFDRARSALETAAKHSADDPRIHECLALTLEAMADTAGAQREYEHALRSLQGKPASVATPYVSYGAFLLKLGRIEQSERMLSRAAEAMPASWQAHFELAKLFYQTDRFEPALKQLQAALQCERTAEESLRTNGMLAIVYSRLGLEDEARRAAAAAQQ